MSIEETDLPESINRNINFTRARTSELCQKLLEPHGLTLPQWVILSLLWRKGDMAIHEIARITKNKRSATSRIVDRMVQSGLLTRKRGDIDMRSVVVGTTAQGQNLSYLSDFHLRVNELLFVGFSADEQGLAFDLLQRLERNAARAIADPPITAS